MQPTCIYLCARLAKDCVEWTERDYAMGWKWEAIAFSMIGWNIDFIMAEMLCHTQYGKHRCLAIYRWHKSCWQSFAENIFTYSNMSICCLKIEYPVNISSYLDMLICHGNTSKIKLAWLLLVVLLPNFNFIFPPLPTMPNSIPHNPPHLSSPTYC